MPTGVFNNNNNSIAKNTLLFSLGSVQLSLQKYSNNNIMKYYNLKVTA